MKQQTNPFAPLYNLLIECCQYNLNNKKLEQYASDIIDWDGFLNSAYAHGVYPLVTKSLKNITTVPNEIKSKLKITNLDIAKRNMMMTTELLKVMMLLEENGIKAIAIKGPVLSQIIYGDITQRQYADIDILITQKDLWNAGQILTKNGFIFEHSLEFLKNKTLLKIAKDISLTNKNKTIRIELHWKLFSGKLLLKSNLAIFHQNPTLCTIKYSQINMLDTEINLLYLLLHGSKHLWERIEWITDIDRLMRTHPGIDWETIIELAKEMGILEMIYLGLAISSTMFGTPLPKSIVICLSDNISIKNAKDKLIIQIRKNLIIHGNQKFLMNLSDLNLSNNKSKRIIFMQNMFRLTTDEIYKFNLPNYLSFLYFILVIYRLFGSLITRFKYRGFLCKKD